ncbi:hypothetical protein H4R35_004175 [Dimargaris xerosporica]|nr:hypothetical protein H4R35_004175 [Dimargaris xerosporica]
MPLTATLGSPRPSPAPPSSALPVASLGKRGMDALGLRSPRLSQADSDQQPPASPALSACSVPAKRTLSPSVRGLFRLRSRPFSQLLSLADRVSKPTASSTWAAGAKRCPGPFIDSTDTSSLRLSRDTSCEPTGIASSSGPAIGVLGLETSDQALALVKGVIATLAEEYQPDGRRYKTITDSCTLEKRELRPREALAAAAADPIHLYHITDSALQGRASPLPSVWPTALASFHGLLICTHVTEWDSVQQVIEVLNLVFKSHIPFALVDFQPQEARTDSPLTPLQSYEACCTPRSPQSSDSKVLSAIASFFNGFYCELPYSHVDPFPSFPRREPLHQVFNALLDHLAMGRSSTSEPAAPYSFLPDPLPLLDTAPTSDTTAFLPASAAAMAHVDHRPCYPSPRVAAHALGLQGLKGAAAPQRVVSHSGTSSPLAHCGDHSPTAPRSPAKLLHTRSVSHHNLSAGRQAPAQVGNAPPPLPAFNPTQLPTPSTVGDFSIQFPLAFVSRAAENRPKTEYQAWVEVANASNDPTKLTDNTPLISLATLRNSDLHAFIRPYTTKAVSTPRGAKFTLNELVDRLVGPDVYRDIRFVNIFLILYQRFATPRQLLFHLLHRFQSTLADCPPMPTSTHCPHPLDTKSSQQHASLQKRICYVLTLWATDYWVDFLCGWADPVPPTTDVADPTATHPIDPVANSLGSDLRPVLHAFLVKCHQELPHLRLSCRKLSDILYASVPALRTRLTVPLERYLVVEGSDAFATESYTSSYSSIACSSDQTVSHRSSRDVFWSFDDMKIPPSQASLATMAPSTRPVTNAASNDNSSLGLSMHPLPNKSQHTAATTVGTTPTQAVDPFHASEHFTSRLHAKLAAAQALSGYPMSDEGDTAVSHCARRVSEAQMSPKQQLDFRQTLTSSQSLPQSPKLGGTIPDPESVPLARPTLAIRRGMASSSLTLDLPAYPPTALPEPESALSSPESISHYSYTSAISKPGRASMATVQSAMLTRTSEASRGSSEPEVYVSCSETPSPTYVSTASLGGAFETSRADGKVTAISVNAALGHESDIDLVAEGSPLGPCPAPPLEATDAVLIDGTDLTDSEQDPKPSALLRKPSRLFALRMPRRLRSTTALQPKSPRTPLTPAAFTDFFAKLSFKTAVTNAGVDTIGMGTEDNDTQVGPRLPPLAASTDSSDTEPDPEADGGLKRFTRTLRLRKFSTASLYPPTMSRDESLPVEPHAATDQLPSRVSPHIQHKLQVLWNYPPNERVHIEVKCVAQQLTYVEVQMFLDIQPRYLLQYLWKPKGRSERGDAMLDLPAPIDPTCDRRPATARAQRAIKQSFTHFNYVAAWVSSKVLSQADLPQRVRMITYFIDIADELLKLHNFNTLMAVLGGLNGTALYRLNRTRAQVEAQFPEHWKRWECLNTIMSADKSYRCYRTLLQQSPLPCIPYLGCCLGDLIFIDESLPESTTEHLNRPQLYWRKFEAIGDMALLFRKIQTGCTYTTRIKPNDYVLQILMAQPCLDDEEAYEQSLHLEPRVRRPSDAKS